jgi:cytochrome b561
VVTRYTRTAIVLHWLMAGLILCSLSVGLYMVGMKLSPGRIKLFNWHKWIGVTIWWFAVVRLGWRATHPAPLLPPSVPGWQRALADASHTLLYALLLIIPLTGWLYSSASGFQVVYFGILPLPDLVHKDAVLADQLKFVHHTLNWTLIGLLVLHVGAALKHHFVDRDDVLARMLPVVRAPGRRSL